MTWWRPGGRRIPEGDDWKDHAVPCPCCDEPVLDEHEHYVNATMIDPGWWKCDPKEEADYGEDDEGDVA